MRYQYLHSYNTILKSHNSDLYFLFYIGTDQKEQRKSSNFLTTLSEKRLHELHNTTTSTNSSSENLKKQVSIYIYLYLMYISSKYEVNIILPIHTVYLLTLHYTNTIYIYLYYACTIP